MTKVALIGASGNVGSRILRELSDRGHSVTGIARDPAKIAKLPHVTAVKGDIADEAGLIGVLRGHEIVISSLRFAGTDPKKLIDVVRASGAKRYLVVGGAASLEVAPGKRLFDQPDFPAAYKAEAGKGIEFLDLLKKTTDLDWTFLSPSAVFTPGQRTGKFRVGTDQLLAGDKGSTVSYEDFAVALVDEIERPAHRRGRFTVGY